MESNRSEMLGKLWLGLACAGVALMALGIGGRLFVTTFDGLYFLIALALIGELLFTIGIAIKIVSFVVDSIEEQTMVLRRIERHLLGEEDEAPDDQNHQILDMFKQIDSTPERRKNRRK